MRVVSVSVNTSIRGVISIGSLDVKTVTDVVLALKVPLAVGSECSLHRRWESGS